MKKFNLLIAFLCFCIYTMAQAQGIGIFSISETEKVTFSPGNLQFNAALGSHQCADGTTQKGTWRFAEHQWDYVGDATNGTVYMVNGNDSVKCNNALISETYDGWIDLFGWGTSGWNSGAVAYQPWETSDTSSYYFNGSNNQNDLIGVWVNADWGMYNQISGDAPMTWRTLTNEEWVYLCNNRSSANKLRGFAIIDGIFGSIFGFVLLPDNWVTPLDLSFTADTTQFNSYTQFTWGKMQSNGAVFFPFGGFRRATNIYNTITNGYYWSSSHDNINTAYYSFFSVAKLISQDYGSKCYGRSVRLIKDIDGKYIPNAIFDSINNTYIQPDTLWYDIILLRDTSIDNDNNYIIKDNSYIKIISAQEGAYEGYIYIPDTIESLPVKAIEEKAFYHSSTSKNKITKFLHISNNLETIGAYAFNQCKALTEINCQKLKVINECAFVNTNLASLSLPEGISLRGSGQFKACYNLQEVSLPQSLKSLPSACFLDCHKLKKISLPQKLETINSQCFYSCASLESITLPNTIKNIHWQAFYGCTSLRQIMFPCSDNLVFHSQIIGGAASKTWELGSWSIVTINSLYCSAENNQLRKIYILSNKKPTFVKDGNGSGNMFDPIIQIKDTITLYVPNNMIDEYKNDTLYHYNNLVIKGIIEESIDSSYLENDTTYTISWPAIPNTSEYHILILDSAKVDTIGEFWIDSLGENITPAAPNTEVAIMRKPKDGSQDLFKLKLKVGNGSNGGTPTPAQAAEMPNGQRKLLTNGETYNCNISGTDAEGETTIDINSDFTVQSQETPDGLINVPHTTHPTTHKEMRDGQILIITPNAKYDLNGRKL